MKASRQGQAAGRARNERRAERVMRPGSERKRVRSVLVVSLGASANWPTQRPRLWAMTCRAGQAAFAPNFPEGK